MKQLRKIEKYRNFIRSQECSMCQYPPRSQAHHITLQEKYKDKRGMGQKVKDQSNLIPLCQKCHLFELHRVGEKKYWEMKKQNPHEIAKYYWNEYENLHTKN